MLSLKIRWRLVTALLTIALAGLAPAQAATITVDSDADDGTGGCTLREAVESANTDAAVGGCVAGDDMTDTIVFDPGVALVILGSQIEITEALALAGNGVASTTIRAAQGARAFDISASGPVTFGSLTIDSAGVTPGSGYPTHGGALLISGNADVGLSLVSLANHRVSDSGGAVWLSATATLNVSFCNLSGNRARGPASTQGGGGIYTDGGDVTVVLTVFSDNRAVGAAGSGGAILNPNGATIDIDDSALNMNRAQRAGGGIETVGGTVTIDGTDLFANNGGANPGNGGGLHATGDAMVTVTGGTVRENRALEGGGFWIGGTATLTLASVTVADNFGTGDDPTQGGGGIYVDGAALIATDGEISSNSAPGVEGSGGGIFNNGGTVTITGTRISRNGAERAGGGIESAGSATVLLDTGTLLEDNRAAASPGNGGGLHVSGPGVVTLNGATVSGNRAAQEGGGLWNSSDGSLSITETTISGNRASVGGGLFQQGSVGLPGPPAAAKSGGRPTGSSIGESLVLGNTAVRGGGLYAAGPVGVSNSTIAANDARFGGGVFSDEAFLTFDSATIARNNGRTSGGGLFNADPNNNGDRFVTLTNTIVAENTAGANGPDLRGRFASQDFNLISTTPGAATFAPEPNDQLGADPLLGMLDDNGGPTRTLALQTGSPAIDAGSTVLATDQRGEPRSDGTDDIGAYEAAAAPMSALVLTGVYDGERTGGTPKGVEIYVLEDIADLSAYGLGSANNGGGTDGQEFTFPADAATAGDFVYVASEIPNFNAFFGFDPDYTSGAMAINGDDAVELFFDGAVVDVYGEQGTNGDGEPWDYTDGWGYREDGTGPDGGSFAVGNWSYAFNGLDGALTNAAAPSPFPIGTYSPVVTAGRTAPALATAAEPVRLGAVTPNPFALRATTSFSVAQAQAVTVSLYDVTGRRVQTLYTGIAEPDTPVAVAVDASGLAAGVYVLVLDGERARATQPVTVVR